MIKPLTVLLKVRIATSKRVEERVWGTSTKSGSRFRRSMRRLRSSNFSSLSLGLLSCTMIRTGDGTKECFAWSQIRVSDSSAMLSNEGARHFPAFLVTSKAAHDSVAPEVTTFWFPCRSEDALSEMYADRKTGLLKLLQSVQCTYGLLQQRHVAVVQKFWGFQLVLQGYQRAGELLCYPCGSAEKGIFSSKTFHSLPWFCGYSMV